ncbi:TIGR04282 family arsenosugar biosynthesis glycosyltransferase [Ascidiaceihabitans sp.]|nr:TIGR04282 family arsenosugar biosynthesis glycosyltransferase [Ascidiaceihabitans sp.]
MTRPTLIIMLKEPRAGRVKTRLGKDIGLTAAAWWFRHQVKRLLRRIDDPRWNVVLAVAPDRAGMLSRVWPAHFERIAQGQGDLGDRMARVIQAIPAGPVCVIGADIPDIGPVQIARAFAALGTSDAVFGPAHDGGFWLVGFKRSNPMPPRLFQDVRWSTEHALGDTRASLGGLRVTLVDELQDIDTVDDLR